MATSPTARTLKYYRDQGYHADVVERWLMHANIRKDLFGFIDIIVMDLGGIIGIQATTKTNMSARKKKILTECREPLEIWLLHARVQVIGWQRHSEPVDNLWWRPTIYDITVEDM